MFGYKVENGIVVVNQSEAEIIIGIFNSYISGMSLRDAAKNAGKEMVHSSVKRIIRNKYYVGDEHYPAIISKEIFAKANAELILRSERHQRPKRLKPPRIYTDFTISAPTIQHVDPVKQAEYLYSLIEVKE